MVPKINIIFTVTFSQEGQIIIASDLVRNWIQMQRKRTFQTSHTDLYLKVLEQSFFHQYRTNLKKNTITFISGFGPSFAFTGVMSSSPIKEL